MRMRIDFRDAAFGLRREVELERLAVCTTCLGNGAQPGTAPIACTTCGGTGEVQSARRSVFGTLDDERALPDVRGHGAGDPRQVRDLRGSGPCARDQQP